jgi:hypothetical protein
LVARHWPGIKPAGALAVVDFRPQNHAVIGFGKAAGLAPLSERECSTCGNRDAATARIKNALE